MCGDPPKGIRSYIEYVLLLSPITFLKCFKYNKYSVFIT